MCVAVPARVVACTSEGATVDLHGSLVPVSILFAPEVAVGDWVLVHAGFVIQRIEAEAVRQNWVLLADLAACEEEADPKGRVAREAEP